MSGISGIGTNFDWNLVMKIARDRFIAARRDCRDWDEDNRQSLIEFWTAKVAHELLTKGIEKQIEVAREYQQKMQSTPVCSVFDEPIKETPVAKNDEDDDETLLTMDDFRNGSDHEFVSLEHEEWRHYVWVKEGELIEIEIDDPVCLHVSESGGHRIFDAQGHSHYIPKGWVEIIWKARDGENHFDF